MVDDDSIIDEKIPKLFIKVVFRNPLTAMINTCLQEKYHFEFMEWYFLNALTPTLRTLSTTCTTKTPQKEILYIYCSLYRFLWSNPLYNL